MGEHAKTLSVETRQLNAFMCSLINDVKALELMLSADMFETDVQRIGAEQELCLLDDAWRPASLAMAVLEQIEDPHFTTEHSRYNLEINLDPLVFEGDCLSRLEAELEALLARLRVVVAGLGGHVVLAGILPTIRRSDLHIDNLTPLPRYHVLNDILNASRGGPYEFRIMGLDELITRHNTIMFEGCNTSFQVHLQVRPDDFVAQYNWAQAVTAPLLAAATNAPLLLGKRLWHETRIALFQQSIDTRRNYDTLREEMPRVTFGREWMRRSITDLFREDLARYRVLLGTDMEEDAVEMLGRGAVPKLAALRFHNGTVYRWNRACYGITEGKPHLRIENRVLPAGPTIVDEVANAAFWLGMMKGRDEALGDVAGRMSFDDAKANFFKAARYGLETQFRWLDGHMVPADRLILDELLPMAREGLDRAGVRAADRDHYLGIVEARVRTRRTGSIWMLASFADLRKKHARYEACVAITAGIVRRQQEGAPVHTWLPVAVEEAGAWVNRYWCVEQIMTTELFTVRPGDAIYFAANVMNWKRLRYIAVEDSQARLVGLLTYRRLLEYFSTSGTDAARRDTVEHVMVKEPRTVTPETRTVDALLLMREKHIGCLPVVKDERLVGMLTEMNFMSVSEESVRTLLEDTRRRDPGVDLP